MDKETALLRELYETIQRMYDMSRFANINTTGRLKVAFECGRYYRLTITEITKAEYEA